MKENLSKFMHAHDTVRIVESLLANGDSNVRDVIFKCLKDQIVDMSKNVYSSFLIQKMIKYGSKEQKAEIVDSFKGEVVNLMKHKIGAKVIEYLYNEYANAHQRGFLIQEFYSHEFRVFKDDKVIDLKSALLKYPSKQAQIIENLKTTLLDMINKGIVQPSIFHTLLKEYLGEAPPGDKAVMIESSRELLVTMVHTRDGSRAAMHSLWYGTSKDRKIILKTFKTHIKSIACNEHGYLVLLAIFDCVDDTVMVFKTIFQELKEALSEVLDNDNGRKVLLYLVAPRDSRFFHPDVVNILKHGDGNVHSKKDATVRWQELLSSVIQPLLTEIEESLDTLILNPKIAILLGVCLEACKDSDMRKHLLAKLASVVTKSQGVIEGPGVQMIIKKVIALDKNIEDKKETFSYHVLEGLSGQLMESWLGCNRGCFCLISMSECGNPEIVTLVSKKLSKFQEVLNCLSHKGAEILKSKLVK